MEINKESLQSKILPSLFYDRTGRKILKNVQTELSNRALSINKILEKFKELSDYKDEHFWTLFLEFFNGAFNSKVGIGNKESFDAMILDIQKIKFDTIFVEDDAEKITNKELLIEYFKEEVESKEGVINLSDESVYRLVIPVKKVYSVNTSFYEPKELNEYPNNLIKIEGDRLSVNISGKLSRNSFFRKIRSSVLEESGGSIIEEFVPDHLDNLQIDTQSLFRNLKMKKLYITKVKFSNPSLYFNIGLRDLLDFQELMDPKFFMNSKMDLISFKEIRFLYSGRIGKNTHDFELTIKIIEKEVDENNFIKFMIYFAKDKLLSEKIEEEIIGIFNENGMNFNQSYELPAEYYLNNIFYEEKSVKQAYDKIQKIDPQNRIIEELIKGGILDLSDDTVSIDYKALDGFKNEMLSKLKNKQIALGGCDYKLLDSFIDKKGRQCLTIRLTNNKSDEASRYNIIIYPDVRTSQKITSIILKHFNYSLIIDKILVGEKDSALKIISTYVYLYLKNRYNLNLEKEANNAYDFLQEFCNDWEKFENKYGAQEAGNLIESFLNILLKSTYRNYLLIGGKNAPDGYLTLLGKNYLLDSKQHRSIALNEFDKIVRYLFTYPLSAGLKSTEQGVFIVCRAKIKSSLNKDARKNWEGSPAFNNQYKFGFVTVEYFLAIYDFFKNQKVKCDPEIIKRIFESFQNIVSASATMDSSSELIKMENTELNAISQSIKEITYTPQRKEQL